MYLKLVIFMILLLSISGCAATMGAQGDDAWQLKSKISSLETELKKQKDENTLLKQQLNEIENKETKMPTAKEIQTALKNSGVYKGQIDGQIGPQTKEAIKKFPDAVKDYKSGNRAY